VNTRQRFGRAAEQAAAKYLIDHGWRVLARNVRVGRGELDLVVCRERVLAFVEVKARRSHTFGTPQDGVGARKQHQIARLAEIWLAARPWALDGIDDVRFDIVAIDASCFPSSVQHLPAAFTIDG
jgi:putative endonuclease